MKVKHSQYLEKVMKDVVQAGSLTAEVAEFYHSLFLFQEKTGETFIADMNESVATFFRKETFPFIDVDKISFPEAILKQLIGSLDELLVIIKNTYEGVKLDSLSELFSRNHLLINDTARLALKGDLSKLKEIADEAKIGTDEFIFITLNWLKPLFAAMREHFFHDVDTTEWLQPQCPFCGFHADMGKIVEGRDNVRLLHCGFCDNEWKFTRLTCAVCANEDAQAQGYFTESDEAIHRIDYCDTCRGYIKTLRIPKKYDESRYDLTVENIITGHLDASAIDKGYNRP
ncbi:MAG: hypothetical protein CVV44_14485 [Spirochaetae bacterium HGW-Spirochaetae-1]|jgi:FdhE protein|nr:MAG: hypothetical protein CVV44_14485 [Spirochaetae bacterium HGW-Spirochaetae-1]